MTLRAVPSSIEPSGGRERSTDIRRGDGSLIAVELAGDRAGTPVLVCHGLADSRLTVRAFESAAREAGVLAVAPDRPGSGGSDPRPLGCVADWASDAGLVLDALGIGEATVVGISGGGAFAAACAAVLPERVRALVLVSPLGAAGWGTRGMAVGERLSLGVATRAPAFGGWFLGRLAALARRSPQLFLRIATVELPEVDRRDLARPGQRDAFLAGFVEAFRRGSAGVAQDLRVLRRPWGFDLDAIRAPTRVYHGEADTTVPPEHARRLAGAIPGAELRLRPGHGHFSLLGAAAAEILAFA